jgi:hypothetical protein
MTLCKIKFSGRHLLVFHLFIGTVLLLPLSAGRVTTSPAHKDRKIIVAKNDVVTVSASGGGEVTMDVTCEGAEVGGGGTNWTVTFGESTVGTTKEIVVKISHVVGEDTCTEDKEFNYTVYVPKITSQTVEESPPDRKRIKLGVGEDVVLTLEPAIGGKWTTDSGKLDGTENPVPNATTVDFEAPHTKATSTITVKFDDFDAAPKIIFNVIRPTGVTLESMNRVEKKDPLELTTECYVYVTPDDVSFIKIKVQEQQCYAQTDGYWTYKQGQAHFRPWPGSPQPLPKGMHSHVVGKGTKMDGNGGTGGTDTVSSVTRGPMGVQYTDGNFLWEIPWKYGITSDQGEFVTVDHRATLRNGGTLTHTKGGMTDSATR